MYDTGFACEILKKLEEVFPRKLHLDEVKAGMPLYKDRPHSEWLSTVHALQLEGALTFSPDGASVADATVLYITELGRLKLAQFAGLAKRANTVIVSEEGATQASEEPLRVFLCHSSGDKQVVRNLYTKLKGEGFEPWLDEEQLLPGQDWNVEIRHAVRSSHVVLVCLSASSITKEGFVQKEIKLALDVADEKPNESIFLIPARLDHCKVPDSLSVWQWVDLYSPGGYERLVISLRSRDIQRNRSRDQFVKNPAQIDTNVEVRPIENSPVQNRRPQPIEQPNSLAQHAKGKTTGQSEASDVLRLVLLAFVSVMISGALSICIGALFRLWREEARLNPNGYGVVFVGCLFVVTAVQLCWQRLAKRSR